MPPPYRILIADDHPIVLEGIRSLLSSDGRLQVTGEASTGKDVIRLTTAQQPDVLVLDIAMPEGQGLEALAILKRRCPETKIVIHTVHTSPPYVHDCLVGGVKGYVVKGDVHANLLTAVLSVLDGKVYLSPSICRTVVERYLAAANLAPAQADWETLTPRERDILRLSAQGLRAKEIARRLELSPKTVENHRYRLMKKLKLPNAPALLSYALEHGLIEPAE
jgi:DNA-binding NarL/FixJ family response regulator